MQLQTDKMQARKEDGVGWMIFNNPERRNAVSLEMWSAIVSILDDFAADPDIRAVVMAGAGGKSFVSGADISQFDKLRSNAAAEVEYGKVSAEARGRLKNLRKPLIAMIKGYCLGGGLGIAMRADIRIASDDSQFGVPAAKLGGPFTFDSLEELVGLVGLARAKEILFTGARYTAADALQFGLINKVVAVDALEASVAGFTSTIVENAPLTLVAMKIAIDEVAKDVADRDMDLVKSAYTTCFDSNDYAEGRRAFMEKRKPVFEGR